MQESNSKKKTKAIEQALASLHIDDINVNSEYLEQYAQKQETELGRTTEATVEETKDNKGMVMRLTRKEGNNGNE